MKANLKKDLITNMYFLLDFIGIDVKKLKSYREFKGGIWFLVHHHWKLGAQIEFEKWCQEIPNDNSAFEYIPLKMENYDKGPKRRATVNLIKTANLFLEEPHICRIMQAVLFAEKAHAGQLRVGGDEYINHPLRVAKLVAENFSHEDKKEATVAIVSAILHDTKEDTEVTIQEINDVFGSRVSKIVASLSLSENPDGTTNEEEPDEIYLKRVSDGGPTAIKIKRYDMLDNVKSLNEADIKFYEDNLQYYKNKLSLWREIDPEGSVLVAKAIRDATPIER